MPTTRARTHTHTQAHNAFNVETYRAPTKKVFSMFFCYRTKKHKMGVSEDGESLESWGVTSVRI